MIDPRVGIGLRQPHYAALLDGDVAEGPGFVEVHSENFFAEGGATLQVLAQARARWPVSLHGVGLGLGSAVGIDERHLDRLARLVERIEPVRVSDHACFARGPGGHAADLLPLAHTAAGLDILCDNVSRVQDRLKRPIAVENVSAYLSFPAEMDEAAFFAALCRRTGCRLLLDLNNLMVNAVNAGTDDPLSMCRAFVEAVPVDVVEELHLAGYVEAGGLAIDDHGSRVRPAVWSLYAHAIARFGPTPTLIEWDTDLPPLEDLLDEARTASTLFS